MATLTHTSFVWDFIVGSAIVTFQVSADVDYRNHVNAMAIELLSIETPFSSHLDDVDPRVRAMVELDIEDRIRDNWSTWEDRILYQSR